MMTEMASVEDVAPRTAWFALGFPIMWMFPIMLTELRFVFLPPASWVFLATSGHRVEGVWGGL